MMRDLKSGARPTCAPSRQNQEQNNPVGHLWIQAVWSEATQTTRQSQSQEPNTNSWAPPPPYCTCITSPGALLLLTSARRISTFLANSKSDFA